MNISTTVVPSHYHFFETSSLEPFSLFYDLIATYYTKRKWQWRQDYVFCLESFHFDKTMFFTSAYFSPSDLKSRLKQKLSSLKPKFCFYDGHINVSIFSNVIRLQLPWEQQKSDLGTSLTYFWHKNERKILFSFSSTYVFDTHVPAFYYQNLLHESKRDTLEQVWILRKFLRLPIFIERLG